MSAEALLAELRRLDIRLRLEDGRLQYDAPRGALTPELLGRVRQDRAALIELLGRPPAPAPPRAIPLRPRVSAGPAPASPAQCRLWFITRLQPDSTSYHIPVGFWIRGPLDPEALRRATEAVTVRHEVLRTALRLEGEQLVQHVEPPGTFDWRHVVASGTTPEARRADAERLAAKWVRLPFDLATAPLVRFGLVDAGPGVHLFSAVFHHAVADGWSFGVLLRELGEFYSQALRGPVTPRPSAVQYSDFAAWLADPGREPLLAGQVRYWRQRLAGAPEVLELPADGPRGDACAEPESAVIAARDWQALTALAASESASPFMAALAVLDVLLGRLAGTDDVVVGTPVAGRADPATHGLVGLFIDNLTLRADLSGNPTFREFLRRVRHDTLEAFAHQDVPFDRLVSELNPRRSLQHAPLFQVLLNVVEPESFVLELEGVSTLRMPPQTIAAKYDLTLYLNPSPEGTRVRAVYNGGLFSPARVQALLGQFRTLVALVAANPDRPVGEYGLANPGPDSPLPDATLPLDPTAPPDVLACLQRLATENPGLVALAQDSRTWTYRELDSASDTISAALRASGVVAGSVVGITGPRCPALVAAILAAWKAGGVVLTLDPALPMARRRLMCDEAKAACLVVVGNVDAGEVASVAAPGIPRLELPAGLPPEATGPLPSPADRGAGTPAYLFFTSGTTGTPKAVLGTHGGLAHFLGWQRTRFAVGPGDRLAQLTGLSFDVVLRDLFLPLTSGATLCLPPADAGMEAATVLPWLQSERITLLHAVPTLAEAWLESVPPGVRLDSLRCVFFAGEPLADVLVERWRRAFPGARRIVNLYGPTETTLAKCWFEVPEPPLPGVQPVGRPIPGAQVLVLNAAGRPCGVGEPGEIVLRTPFRTLGYPNAPAESARRFRPNPFRDDPTDLVHHSGDRGRFRPDGTVEILGRLDDQVKIGGVRIEPGEVQAAIQRVAGVHAAAVVAVRDGTGTPRLVACAAAGPDPDPSLAAAIRAQLARSLPAAFIPSTLVVVDRLPTTPNGKLDRVAIAALEADDAERPAGPAPSTPEERAVADVWQGLLGRAMPDATASFFDLGGHSLMAIRMLARVREATGRDVPLRVLFEDPTIAGLARAMGRASTPSVPAWCRSLCALKPTGTRPPLFVFPGGNGGDRELYVHAHLAEVHLGEDHPVYGLRRRGWDGQAVPHDDLASMVRDYLAEIRAVQPHGPYFLLGDCTGGNVAFALACRLQEEGEPVGWLALADCIVPRTGEYARYWTRSRWRRLRQSFAGRVMFNLPRLASVATPRGREWLRARLAAQRQRSEEAVAGHAPEPEYWTPEGELYRRAVTTHRPGTFRGRLHLVLSEGKDANRIFLDWEQHTTGGLEVHPFTGDHWEYLWQDAEKLAGLVRQHVRHGP